MFIIIIIIVTFILYMLIYDYVNAFWQGARVRHRLRQPACRSLCHDIMQMQQRMAEPGDVQAASYAHLHRQLKQYLRVRRWGLAYWLSVVFPSSAS